MKRVLIVDDDRATSAGMADVVEEWGYEPEVADTVKAGWSGLYKKIWGVAGTPHACHECSRNSGAKTGNCTRVNLQPAGQPPCARR